MGTWCALAALLVLVLASLPRGNQARAAPSSNDGEVARSDQRVPSASSLMRAMARKAVLCGAPMKRSFVSGTLALLGARGSLDEGLATELACALDAPAGATCETLRRCSGEAVGASGKAVCDGDVLRFKTSEGKSGSVSCAAFGERCFQSGIAAVCGVGPCEADETYRCDQNMVSACVSGVRTHHACGLGFTCGRTQGNKIIDCIGAAGTSCQQERCDDQEAVTCVTDAFGGATERRVNCAELGLRCSATSKGGETRAGCLAPPTPATPVCAASEGIECDGANVRLCGGDKAYTFSCSELGSAGACVAVALGSVRCQ